MYRSLIWVGLILLLATPGCGTSPIFHNGPGKKFQGDDGQPIIVTKSQKQNSDDATGEKLITASVQTPIEDPTTKELDNEVESTVEPTVEPSVDPTVDLGPSVQENAIENICDDPSKQVVENYTLVFEERQGCLWGQNDNLPWSRAEFNKYNGVIAARHITTKELVREPSKTICRMEVKSAKNDFEYDDNIFVTVNDIVVLSSNTYLVKQMPQVEEVSLWDWSSIKGIKYTADIIDYHKPYCLSPGKCELPGQSKVGAVAFQLKYDQIKDVLDLQNTEKLAFSVVVGGDNDPQLDCYNKELQLNISLTNVSP